MYVENTAAAEEVSDEMQGVAVPMPVKRVVQVFLIGLMMGLVVWGLSFILETYVLRTLLCQGSQSMQCAPATAYGQITASIFAAVIGLFGLVKLQVFRPLVVILAVTIGLWGVVGMMDTFEVYWALPICMLIYAGAYVLFAWMARTRVFWLMILMTFIMVLALRFALTV